MARIRTIKPEFWSSEQVMECSPNARLLFIGLWNFADDFGRMTNSPKRIKAQIFPSDDFSSENVRGMIDELISNDLLLDYTIENVRYLQITGWKHQRVDKPQPSKFPPAPHPNSHRPELVSTNDPGMIADGREGNGRDLKGEESKPNPQQPELGAVADDQKLRWTRSSLDELETACREAAGLERHPGTGLLVIGPIADLIDAGWSLERHILPALRSAKARGGKPGSTWAYYAKIVTNGALEPPKAAAPPADAAVNPADLDPRKMAAIFVNLNKWMWPDLPEPGQAGCLVTPEMIDAARMEQAQQARCIVEANERGESEWPN